MKLTLTTRELDTINELVARARFEEVNSFWQREFREYRLESLRHFNRPNRVSYSIWNTDPENKRRLGGKHIAEIE